MSVAQLEALWGPGLIAYLKETQCIRKTKPQRRGRRTVLGNASAGLVPGVEEACGIGGPFSSLQSFVFGVHMHTGMGMRLKPRASH